MNAIEKFSKLAFLILILVNVLSIILTGHHYYLYNSLQTEKN
jgi:uncharacterized protein (UPF0333 family)